VRKRHSALDGAVFSLTLTALRRRYPGLLLPSPLPKLPSLLPRPLPPLSTVDTCVPSEVAISLRNHCNAAHTIEILSESPHEHRPQPPLRRAGTPGRLHRQGSVRRGLLRLGCPQGDAPR